MPRRTLLLVTCLLLVPAPLAAQGTGGSFGSSSGSWGSGSGGRSSGSSGSSGSSFGSSSGSSFGRSSGSSFGSSGSSFGESSRARDRSGGSSFSEDTYRDTYEAPARPSAAERWRRGRVEQGAPPVTETERAAMQPVPPPIPLWGYAAGVFTLLLGGRYGIAWLLRRRREPEEEDPFPSLVPRMRTATLRRISVGLDWTAREALQAQMAQLARTLSIDTPAERAAAARRVLALVGEHLSGARYACTSAVQKPLQAAPGELERLAIDLRARFKHETAGRGADAPVPELAARPDEGPGMIVVSLLVGSTRAPSAVPSITDRASLGAALAGFVPEGELDGLEVIWSPSEPDDRMSSYELERLYPELVRLADAGAIGTVTCAHCRAPYPRELEHCPRCGADA